MKKNYNQKEQKLKTCYFKNQNAYEEEQTLRPLISLKVCTDLVDFTQYVALRCECTKQSFKKLLAKITSAVAVNS